MTVGVVEFELEDARRVIVRDMLTITRATDQFLGDCTRRGYSQRTVDTYQRLLDKFADICPADYDVGQVTEDDCRRYLDGFNRKAAGTRAHAFSVLSSFFKWLDLNEKIKRNPMQRMQRPRRIAPEDLDVVTVSSDDVRRMLEYARPGAERVALYVLAYLGPRRRAVSRLRLKDYDSARRRLRFYEKGGKTIWKRVPAKLADVLDAEIKAGSYSSADDYLVPNEGPRSRTGERDDRVIWRLVKTVADRAGVEAHVHALRAAFAVEYLSRPGTDLLQVQETLGHASTETTRVYLRKRNKEAAMEPLLAFDWGDNTDAAQVSQIAGARLAASGGVGAGGFEPPFDPSSSPERLGRQHDGPAS